MIQTFVFKYKWIVLDTDKIRWLVDNAFSEKDQSSFSEYKL